LKRTANLKLRIARIARNPWKCSFHFALPALNILFSYVHFFRKIFLTADSADIADEGSVVLKPSAPSAKSAVKCPGILPHDTLI